MLTWGVLIGLGTGSMALVFAATDRQPLVRTPPRPGDGHPHRRRRHRAADLPAGDGRAGRAAGLAAASLVVAGAALAVVPLVVLVLRDYPADLGVYARTALPAGPGRDRRPRSDSTGTPRSRAVARAARGGA